MSALSAYKQAAEEKRIHHKEAGSETMERIAGEAGSRLVIAARLSIVEMEAVQATKVRAREIDQLGVELGRRCLGADLIQRRLIVMPRLESRHYQGARLLLVRFGASEGLRTLDTRQLSLALELRILRQHFLFVASDQRLCWIALLAGCAALNPEKPRSTLP